MTSSRAHKSASFPSLFHPKIGDVAFGFGIEVGGMPFFMFSRWLSFLLKEKIIPPLGMHHVKWWLSDFSCSMESILRNWKSLREYFTLLSQESPTKSVEKSFIAKRKEFRGHFNYDEKFPTSCWLSICAFFCFSSSNPLRHACNTFSISSRSLRSFIFFCCFRVEKPEFLCTARCWVDDSRDIQKWDVEVIDVGISRIATSGPQTSIIFISMRMYQSFAQEREQEEDLSL